MITKLSISNFKSVRHLDIDCKKVNLFIGEPNTGKSNILEALGLLSWCGQGRDTALSDMIRFQTMSNLFYDQLLDEEVRVNLSTSDASHPELHVALKHDRSKFQLLTKGHPFRVVTHEGNLDEPMTAVSTPLGRVKFFRFKKLEKYDGNEADGLRPPSGTNLFSVVLSSKALREIMVEFFRKYELKLVMKPQEKMFELQKQVDDLVFSYPYTLTSDTLLRIIFYTVAIASNEDSVLVFEEPESNAFPYYTTRRTSSLSRRTICICFRPSSRRPPNRTFKSS